MAVLTLTNTFTPNTLAESSEVNQNFDEVETFVNGSVMHRDASGAFTAVPSGPASDPISANQLARKAYVDLGPSVYRLTGAGGALTASMANVMGGGQMILPAGSYLMIASVRTDSSTAGRFTHTARIQNVTDATTVLQRDHSVDSAGTDNANSWDVIDAITIAATKTFELQMQTDVLGGTQLAGPNLRLLAIRIREIL